MNFADPLVVTDGDHVTVSLGYDLAGTLTVGEIASSYPAAAARIEEIVNRSDAAVHDRVETVDEDQLVLARHRLEPRGAPAAVHAVEAVDAG